MNTTIDLNADTIDVRDIIARVEELREELADYENPEGDLEAHDENLEQQGELAALAFILEDLAGNGGDEQWEGDWYPVTLIRDSYFQEYAQELAEDCGFISGNEWPARCIDWEQAARELQMDYTSTEIDGVTYWYR